MSSIRIGELEHLQGELAQVGAGLTRCAAMAAALSARLEKVMQRHRVQAPARFIREVSGDVFACEDAG